MTRQIVPKNKNDSIKKSVIDPDPENMTKPKTWSHTCIKNILQLRLHTLHLNQEEFARRLNVNVNVIKNLENGKSNYDGKLVHKINQIFKVNINN